ncbi:MAG TPA: hypothetical protein VHL99_03380 [Candidatus Binatia bacterium]|jgi:hypothetical protein|nr:hypothetical protein [Candidatus Binatia bacterium]
MRASDELKPGPEMDALVAEAVMGWKDVRRESGGAGYRGKRPDKLGRFRAARVPPYSTEAREAAALGPRLERLGRYRQFLKQLESMAHAANVPAEWAPPEYLCRAALTAVGMRAAQAPPAERRPARRADALRRRRKHVSAGR